jgi:PAS domain S-box-containing protein
MNNLDEILTMSTRMAAATGNSQWENRYRKHEPELTAAIQEFIVTESEILDGKAAVKTAMAHHNLVAMENKAFDLVRQANREAAQVLLDGREYEMQKQLYSDGMTEFTDSMSTYVKAEKEKHHLRMLLTVVFTAIAGSAVAFAWFAKLRAIRRISERKSLEENALRSSEEHFRGIFEHTAVGVYRTTADGRILMANPALVRMLGYSSFEELSQRNLEKDGYEPQYPRSEFKERVEKDGEVIGLESAWTRRDGSTLFIIENCRAIRDEHGNTLYYEGTAENITERKRSEQKLRESEEKYRTLVESAGDAIATIDRNGVLVFMNSTAAERLGGKPQDYIGSTIWDLFPKEIADRQAQKTREVIETGKEARATELTEVRGQLRWYDTKIEPLRDSSGKIVAALVIARDIHEAKQAQEELRRYHEEMARAEQLASLGTLSATLAHELKQPLSIIRLSVQNALAQMETTCCPAPAAQELKRAVAEVSIVKAIVDNFRNLAQVRPAGRSVAKVDLNTVAKRILNLFSERARQARIALELDGTDRLPHIDACEKDMEQLFFAVVENAIQAADGEKQCRLVVGGTAEDAHINLSFSDNCGGIAEENLDRVFEPFFTTGPPGERTGLGLSIVERIVSDAGGEVHVRSNFGKGTTSLVRLPINQCKDS